MRKFIILVIPFLLLGCDYEERGYELHRVFKQRILNSSNSIYSYEAWSTLNDGSKYGYAVLDSSESVGIREVEQMPFKILTKSPTKDTISIIKLNEGDNRSPKYLSTNFSNYKGIVIKTDNYSYQVGTSTNLDYKFDRFEETQDSLKLKGIKVIYFKTPYSRNEIGFRKGNIKLIESDTISNKLDCIKITAFLQKEYSGHSIDNQTVIRNDSLKINGLVYFSFYPTDTIYLNEFTDFGLYKQQTITDKRAINKARKHNN